MYFAFTADAKLCHLSGHQQSNPIMMNCPIAEALLDEYAIATVKYFDAAERLTSLPVSHADFKDAKFLVEEAAMECRQTRLALERHRLEHDCMVAVASNTALREPTL